MRPGDVLEIEIEKGIYRGLGLGRFEGRAILVPRGLPGERLRVRVTAVERGFSRAVPEAVLTPSAQRREAPCPFAPDCGGCAYQELDYAAQLELKEAILRETLSRARVAWSGSVGIVPSPRVGWRLRATFHVSASGNRVRLGLREEGSHRVVDLPRCLQVSEAMNAALEGVRRGLERRAALAARVSDVRVLENREGGQVVVGLTGALEAGDTPALLGLQDGTPLAGLVARLGLARHSTRLTGTDAVSAEVLGRRFRIHCDSFFQGNRFLIEPLAERVRQLLPGSGDVLDLYAGVGLFALTLAEGASSVLGVEGSPSAVADAMANADAAGYAHVRFREGDVRRALATLAAGAHERIVLDPPRAGVGPEVARAVIARDPEAIAYVSCDPATLARDLGTFRAGGYELSSLDLFDLFPDTFHLETLALLRPARDL